MSKKNYVCQQCGSSFNKWKGRCEGCDQWNTLVLEHAPLTPAFQSMSQEEETPVRFSTGMAELDRVCGGGIVRGSVSLVAGDPGIGKSTLLLQTAHHLSAQVTTIYVSGEESPSQVRLRAKRLGIDNTAIHLMSTNDLDQVFSAVTRMATGPHAFIIIDSIQTMMIKEVGASAGTIGQVRECMAHLMTFAKSTGISVIVVGHITKDGMIAGPKVLEHMVDTVLYFEGETSRHYRLLRTMKNRFGSTHEVGIFDMTAQGLAEVRNPSALFISKRTQEVSGACVFAGMEGTRPILVEFQALATLSFLASPRRSVVGWDYNRLSMILAVLEARCKIPFSKKDIFLTVLGGLKINEPSADLCVALALLSYLQRRAIPMRAVAFGEIGLTGEIYATSFTEQRLKEAEQLGFNEIFMPVCPSLSKSCDHSPTDASPIVYHTMNHVKDLDAWFRMKG